MNCTIANLPCSPLVNLFKYSNHSPYQCIHLHTYNYGHSISIFNSSRTELSNEDLNRRWLTPKYVTFFFLLFVNHFLNDFIFLFIACRVKFTQFASPSNHLSRQGIHRSVSLFWLLFSFKSRYYAHFGRVYSSSYVGYWMQNRPFCVICTVIPVASTPLCTDVKARRVGVQTIGHRKMVKVTILP